MVSILLSAILLLSAPDCTNNVVRAKDSSAGAVATERNTICTANEYVTTASNDIYVRTGEGPQKSEVLVARLDSLGKIGAPLSWRGRTLVIHVPKGYRVRQMRRRVGRYFISVLEDYSDKQQLRDAR